MKSCSSCGRHLEDPERFCDSCGAPQPVAPSIPYRPPQTLRLPSLRGTQINIMRLSVVLLLVGAAIGFTIGGATFYTSQRPGTQTLTVTNIVTSLQRVTETRTQFVTTTQTILQTTSTPATTGGWREIKRFTESTDMTTESFSVPSTTWRIKWYYEHRIGTSDTAYFRMTVYSVGQTIWVESVGPVQTPTGSGTTYIYKGPGEFYVKLSIINADYTIIVEVPT